jgi:hypothetical protein
MVTLPGVMLENVGPPPSARAQPPQGPPPRAAAPPVIATVPPTTAAVDPPVARRAPVVAVPPPAAQAEPKKKPVPKVTEPSAPRPKATATAGAVAGASGYVAVLASKSSRMDALKAFADLQQKYGDVLANKTPDVQEANLGEKGMWYRAVVGPPGSREAASQVCVQLKSAGHAGCWVTAY